MTRGSKPLVALFLLFSATSVQPGDLLAPPDLAGYLRWGPLRVRPGIQISELGYDDNIFLNADGDIVLDTDGNIVPNPNPPVSDYRVTISPKLDGLVLLGSRAFVTFKEKLEYNAYFDHREQNYINQHGTARLSLPMSRIALFGDLRLDRVQDRPVDQDDQRLERDDDGFGLGFLVQAGWRTEIEIGWSHLSRSHFDPDAANPDAISRRLDRTETGLTFKSSYRIRGRTRLTLEARTLDLNFDADSDSRAWEVRPGIRFDAGGRLTGSLNLGRIRISAEGTGRPNLSDTVGKAELGYRPNSRLTFKFIGERTPGFAIYRDSTYYLQRSYKLRSLYYFNRAIGLESNVGYGELSFPESKDLEPRRDKNYRYQVGIRLRMSDNSLGRRIEYSLLYGRYRRDSIPATLNQSRSTFSVNADVGF